MKKEIMVYWVVMPYSMFIGYHYVGEPCCLHIQD